MSFQVSNEIHCHQMNSEQTQISLLLGISVIIILKECEFLEDLVCSWKILEEVGGTCRNFLWCDLLRTRVQYRKSVRT